jgi:dolichol-phosphate mannosyltransferase
MIVRVPGFARYFLWEHNVNRFVDGLNHSHPFWFYLPVLLVACIPWTFVAWPWLKYQFSRDSDLAALRPLASGFYLLAAAWIVGFFSISSCKLPPYVLPALPPVAILLGVFLEQAIFGRGRAACLVQVRSWVPWFTTGSICVAALVVTWTVHLLGFNTGFEVILESAVCIALWLVNARWGRRLSPIAAWGLCSVLTLAITGESIRDLVPDWARSQGPLPRTERTQALLADRELPIIAMCREWGSLPFYLHRDDIQCFDGPPTWELISKLRQHSRTLVIHRPSYDIDELQQALPDGLQLKLVEAAGRTSVWLIEPVQTAQRASKR